MKPKTLQINLLIHVFALAHAVVVILLNHLHLPDDIPLTLLTITMIIWVAHTYRFPLDISAAMALLFCFAGFFMGTKGAQMFSFFNDPSMVRYANAITTFVVTEILGWSTYFIVYRTKKE